MRFRRYCYYNQKLTLLQRCVSWRRFSDLVLTLQQRRGSDVVFLTKILNMFQYHYNFLFPKICNITLQFHFLINKIYSVCVNAKRSLKWWIFENLELAAWAEKRDFWSCVARWSETAPYFLAVNSVGSWFNYFLHSGSQNTGV